MSNALGLEIDGGCATTERNVGGIISAIPEGVLSRVERYGVRGRQLGQDTETTSGICNRVNCLIYAFQPNGGISKIARTA